MGIFSFLYNHTILQTILEEVWLLRIVMMIMKDFNAVVFHLSAYSNPRHCYMLCILISFRSYNHLDACTIVIPNLKMRKMRLRKDK